MVHQNKQTFVALDQRQTSKTPFKKAGPDHRVRRDIAFEAGPDCLGDQSGEDDDMVPGGELTLQDLTRQTCKCRRLYKGLQDP
jgi:hypothetical protein